MPQSPISIVQTAPPNYRRDFSGLRASLRAAEEKRETALDAAQQFRNQLRGTTFLEQDSPYIEQARAELIPEIESIASSGMSPGQMHRQVRKLARRYAEVVEPAEQRAKARAEYRGALLDQFDPDQAAQRLAVYDQGLPGLEYGAENYGYMGKSPRMWQAPVDLQQKALTTVGQIRPDTFNIVIDENGDVNLKHAMDFLDSEYGPGQGSSMVAEALIRAGIPSGKVPAGTTGEVATKVINDALIEQVVLRTIQNDPAAMAYLREQAELDAASPDLQSELVTKLADERIDDQLAVANGEMTQEELERRDAVRQQRLEDPSGYAIQKRLEPIVQNASNIYGRSESNLQLHNIPGYAQMLREAGKRDALIEESNSLRVGARNLSLTEGKSLGKVLREELKTRNKPRKSDEAANQLQSEMIRHYDAQFMYFDPQRSADVEGLAKEINNLPGRSMTSEKLVEQMKQHAMRDTETQLSPRETGRGGDYVPRSQANDPFYAGLPKTVRDLYDNVYKQYRDGWKEFDLESYAHSIVDEKAAAATVRDMGVENLASFDAVVPAVWSENMDDYWDVDEEDTTERVLQFFNRDDVRITGWRESGEFTPFTFMATDFETGQRVSFAIPKGNEELAADLVLKVFNSPAAAARMRYYTGTLNEQMSASGQATVPGTRGLVIKRSNETGRTAIKAYPGGREKALTALEVHNVLERITEPPIYAAVKRTLFNHVYRELGRTNKALQTSLDLDVLKAYLDVARLKDAADPQAVELAKDLDKDERRSIDAVLEKEIAFDGRGPAIEIAEMAREYGRASTTESQ